MHKFGFLLLAALGTTTAHAIVNGTPVSQAEYDDFMVHIKVAQSNCSGSLIAGQYLLTARHCIMPISGPNSGILTSNDITIKQGVTKSTALTYQRTFTFFNSVDAELEKDATASEIYTDVVNNYPLNGVVNLNNWGYQSDLVILKLNSPIDHTTGAILSPIYDPATNATFLPKNTDFVFRGWGYINEAGTSLADTLQKSTAQIFIDYKDAANPGQQLDPKYGYHYTTCIDAPNATCQWYQNDYTAFFSTADSYAIEGDSGSPILYNDRVFGVLSKSNASYVHQHQMADLTLLMDALVPYFDQVLYPSAPGKHIKSGDTSTYTIKVPVQNMTSNSILFTPVLIDSTGSFTADVTDCNRTIKSKDGCVVNVTFNAAKEAITSVKTASLYLSSDVQIPLTVDFKSITSGNTDSGNSSSGGGGSTGGTIILALIMLFGMRSFKK